MNRNPDWLSQLQMIVQQRKDIPHSWGSNDCCLFAADCILAMTGVDIASDLRGQYTDEAGAEKLIEQFGGSLSALATHFLGDSTGPCCARRGDIVLFDTSSGTEAIGVCVGSQFVCPGDEKLNAFMMENAKRCWRVG